jgi:exodeoxyribonuclease VII large subunit
LSIHYRQHGTSIIVFGNTFPIKEKIKALGGRFNGSEKNWSIPHTDESLRSVAELCAAHGGGRLGDGAPVKAEAAVLARASLTVATISSSAGTADAGGLFPGAMLPSWDQPGNAVPARSEPAAAPADQGLTIRQLMDRAAAAITGAFPAPVWVVGEIQNLSRRASGVFFDLAEGATGGHQNGTVTARAIVWSGALAAIRKRREGDTLDGVLQDGMQVRCLCQVQLYRDRGQISLVIEDIDPTYTRGALALAREKLLRELRAKGLDQLNKRRALAPFPFRVGLISADGSRAASDFLDQLKMLAFPGEILFCPTPMQGEAVPARVTTAIAALVRAEVDVIVITRGGGSAADLRWFDAPEIAYAIAQCPLPIVAAIGHHDDVCVAEEICFMRQKTPTAAADFIVGCFHATRERIDAMATSLAQLLTRRIDDFSELQAALGERLAAAGRQALEARLARLQQRAHRLHTGAVERLLAASTRILCHSLPSLARAADQLLGKRRDRLAELEKTLVQRDPTPWLAQGWTRLFGASGQTITSVRHAAPGEAVSARLGDGRLALTVTAAVPLRPSTDATEADKGKDP